MGRRWIFGAVAAAALLASSAGVGSVSRVQAQAFDCAAEFGGNAACGEVRFNMSPAPDTMPPAPVLANPPAPAPMVAAQPGAQAQSQAGPQEDAQPAGME